MAARSHRARGIVIGKTKLGESDIIVTFLTEDGSSIRAVAKGGRKPGGTFASRLEYFSEADVLVAEGKSLGIVQEARIVNAHAPIRANVERTLSALPVIELLAKTSEEGLENPRLFAMAEAFLDHVDEGANETSLALCAAALLKIIALLGFKPSLDSCVQCGSMVSLEDASRTVTFSFTDGGVVCESCRTAYDSMEIDVPTIAWAHHFLYATFAEIVCEPIDETVVLRVLQFSQQWVLMHAGVRLKSLDSLMTSGVYAQAEDEKNSI